MASPGRPPLPGPTSVVRQEPSLPPAETAAHLRAELAGPAVPDVVSLDSAETHAVVALLQQVAYDHPDDDLGRVAAELADRIERR